MIIDPATVAAVETVQTVADAMGVMSRTVRITRKSGETVDGFKVSWNVAGGRRVGIMTDDIDTATAYHNRAMGAAMAARG